MIVAAVSPAVGADELHGYILHEVGTNPDQQLRRVVMGDPWPSTEPVATLQRAVSGTAVSPDGELLALDGATDELVRIDVATGDVETLVALDIDIAPWWIFEADLAIDTNGGAWIVSRGILYELDLATGVTSVVGDTGSDIGILVSHDGELYAAGLSNFLRISPDTAHAVVIATYSGTEWDCFFSGLTSIGRTLQGLYQCWNVGAPNEPRIVTVDTADGHVDPIGVLFDLDPWQPNYAFEVIAVPTDDTAIPELSLAGRIGFALMLALAAAVLLRRAR